MPHLPKSPESTLVAKAGERIQRFEQDVGEEAWKTQHAVAMRCFALQDTIASGLCLYHSLVALDEAVRDALLSDPKRSNAQTAAVLAEIHKLFAWWLKPCSNVDRAIAELEGQGFEVDGAANFRSCYAEARWIVDENALSHPKMVEARDAAIDALRSGDAT
jgi:hypothetical protein